MYEEKYKLVVEGITPLLMERYENKDGSSKKGELYDKDWLSLAYTAGLGASIKDKRLVVGKTLIIREEMFKACLAVGAKGFHRGKVYYGKFLSWGLGFDFFETPIFLSKDILQESRDRIISIDDLIKNEDTWVNEFRRTLEKKTSVWSKRPQIPAGWILKWDITIRSETLQPKIIEEIITMAGCQAGIGGQRPSSPNKPGSFGQFKIISFDKSSKNGAEELSA